MPKPPLTRLQQADRDAAARWHPVESSNVRAVCYRDDPQDGSAQWGLGVWFAPTDRRTGAHKGAQSVYWYRAPYEVFTEMRHAPSKGKFVHQRLKGHFDALGPFPPGV